MSALGLAVDPAALPAWAALAAALLLVLGATVVLIGALGLLRLPTFYQRVHGPAIAITLGALVFGEVFGLAQIVGLLLIAAGLAAIDGRLLKRLPRPAI